MDPMYLIEKKGLYYRPEAKGYTYLKREAGRYTFEEAAVRVGPNGPDGSQDGMSMWLQDEAPEFSSGADQITRQEEFIRKRVRNETLDEAAALARHRYKTWHSGSGVSCDASACEEIAKGIESLKEESVTC